MPKRPVELEDLLRIRLVGDSQIAPDGRRVVFTVRKPDVESNRYKTALWMAGSGEAHPFTGEGHNDSLPRWSPDGRRIAFCSDREEPGDQIYLISPDGGEALKLTKLEEGSLSELVWSPDGTKLAFIYRPTPAEWTKKAVKEREEKKLSPPARRHAKLFYRMDGLGYYDGCYGEVWIADAETGEASRLASGEGDHHSVCFSPGGDRVYFIANRREDHDLTIQYDSLWSVGIGGGESTRIPAPDGPKAALAVSPDGSLLGYLGSTDPEDTWGCTNQRVLVIPSEGSETSLDLTGERDIEAAYGTLSDVHESGGGVLLAWSPDGKWLLFPGAERGEQRLYRVSLPGGSVEALTPSGMELCAFTQSADGVTLGLVLGSSLCLHDVYVQTITVGEAHPAASEGFAPKRMSDLHRDLLGEMELQTPLSFETRATDGYPVHGWILKPPVSSGKSPCVVYVHGGPALQYGGPGTPFHELQWLAARGYVVVYSNPRGSKGYGEAHSSAIKGDWGNKDWLDVQAVSDHASSLAEVDSSRMAIMGGSYGGFMTAWAIGHTNRFRCAIADRLVANMHSMSGTCDFPWEHGKFYRGNAWDDPSDLWAHSPLAYAGKIETPLLILHSDGDLRCPAGQAEELFAALRLQRKRVEFVRYPANTSHGLSRNGPPDMRLDRLRRNLEWLDRWLKPCPEASSK